MDPQQIAEIKHSLQVSASRQSLSILSTQGEYEVKSCSCEQESDVSDNTFDTNRQRTGWSKRENSAGIDLSALKTSTVSLPRKSTLIWT